MSEAAAPVVERSTLGLHTLEQYESLIGTDSVERIARKADQIRTQRIVHISSYGGGVSEILTPLILMMNAIGIETGWHIIQGTPQFFSCTKKIHNALQGQEFHSPISKNRYTTRPSQRTRCGCNSTDVMRERLGARAKETVRKRFLMSRLLEDWVDLLAMYQGRASG